MRSRSPPAAGHSANYGNFSLQSYCTLDVPDSRGLKKWRVGKSILPPGVKMVRSRIKHHWLGRKGSDLWVTELLNFPQVQLSSDFLFKTELKSTSIVDMGKPKEMGEQTWGEFTRIL